MQIPLQPGENPANIPVISELADAVDDYLNSHLLRYMYFGPGEDVVLQVGALTGTEVMATSERLGQPVPSDEAAEAQAAQMNEEILGQFAEQITIYGHDVLQMAAEALITDPANLAALVGSGDGLVPFDYRHADMGMGTTAISGEETGEQVTALRYGIIGNEDFGEIAAFNVLHSLGLTTGHYGILTVKELPVLTNYAETTNPQAIWRLFYELDQSPTIPEQYMAILQGNIADPDDVTSALQELVAPYLGTEKETKALFLSTALSSAPSPQTMEHGAIPPDKAVALTELLRGIDLQ